MILNFHIQKIKAFAIKFATYNEIISEEIMNTSISQTAEKGFYQQLTMESELNNDISFMDTSKGTLTIFMNYINKLIEVSDNFKNFSIK